MSEPAYNPDAPSIGYLRVKMRVAGEAHVSEYDVSVAPWTFRDWLCFVQFGHERCTKVPLQNVVNFRFEPELVVA